MRLLTSVKGEVSAELAPGAPRPDGQTARRDVFTSRSSGLSLLRSRVNFKRTLKSHWILLGRRLIKVRSKRKSFSSRLFSLTVPKQEVWAPLMKPHTESSSLPPPPPARSPGTRPRANSCIRAACGVHAARGAPDLISGGEAE